MPARKILIVDDVKFAIEMARKTLERADCTFLTAENGEEALKIARAEKPDLIFLDVYMPKMGGEECCRIIKGDPLVSHIPIVFVTTASREEAAEKCREAGGDDFIIKPFSGDALFRKAQKFVPLKAREHIRRLCGGKITFEINGTAYRGELHDLSDTGLFIESKSLLAAGSLIDMEFSLPGARETLKARGEVVRIMRESTLPGRVAGTSDGMGVRFTSLSDETKTAILNFTHHL